MIYDSRKTDAVVRLTFLMIMMVTPVLANPALGQDPGGKEEPPLTVWVSGGYGLAQTPDSFSKTVEEAFQLSLSLQWRPFVVSARYVLVSQAIGHNLDDWGVMVGLGTSPLQKYHASAAVGVGRAEVSNVSLFGGDSESAFTVPLQVQLAWRFSKYVGIGLYGFASLNDDSSFYGATLAFQAGRLR